MTYQVLDNGVVRDATPDEVLEIETRVADHSIRVPEKVTRRQALQALFLDGKLDLVEPAIEANFTSPQKELALIEWRDSLDFYRDRPLVHAMGTLLGLTESDIDDLFVTANTL